MESLDLLETLLELVARVLGKSRDRAFGEKLNALAAAMKAGQPISAGFRAALHEIAPGSSRHHRWKRGQVQISPSAVLWASRGQVTELTGASCADERLPDWPGADRRLTLPGYQATSIWVLPLRIRGVELEIAAPDEIIEIIRYALSKG